VIKVQGYALGEINQSFLQPHWSDVGTQTGLRLLQIKRQNICSQAGLEGHQQITAHLSYLGDSQLNSLAAIKSEIPLFIIVSMRVSTVLTAVTSLLITAVTADFHILTGNCIEKEFSKRDSLSRFDLAAGGHQSDARAFELGPDGEAADIELNLEKRQKSGGGPAKWHESDRYSIANLMPSQNYGCNWLQNNQVLSYYTLPDSYFHAKNLCGKPLDFYKKGDRWEVWHSGANPGKKYGECYPDLSTFTCDLWVGLFQEKCNWSRKWVCAMPVC